MFFPASDARNTTRFATSSGLTISPSGTRHSRIHPSGAKRIHRNLSWRKLEREGTGETDQSRFGRAVSCITRHTKFSEDGRHHDDPPAVWDVRDSCANDVVGTDKICLDDVQPWERD